MYMCSVFITVSLRCISFIRFDELYVLLTMSQLVNNEIYIYLNCCSLYFIIVKVNVKLGFSVKVVLVFREVDLYVM